MKSIGNIERFLVVGIVIVIGGILAIAIKGANDVNSEYDRQVAAKSGSSDADEARSPKPAGSRSPASGDAPRVGGARPSRADDPVRDRKAAATLDPALQEAFKKRQDALAGRSAAPASEPAPSDGADPSGVRSDGAGANRGEDPGEAPVVEEDSKAGAASLALSEPLLRASQPGGTADPDRRDEPKREPEPAPASTGPWYYEVQGGDSLERIARTLYGDRALWQELLDANPELPDADTIRAGMKLRLPRAPVAASGAVVQGSSAPATAPSRATEAAPDAGEKPAVRRITASESYVVQSGDTLMSIAASHYGTRSAWRLILAANDDRIADKDRIVAGTTLRLPSD